MCVRARVAALGLIGAFGIALATAPFPLLAQGGPGTGQYGPAIVPLPAAATGKPIARITIEIAASSGDPVRDEAALGAARAATGTLAGRPYRPLLVDMALGALVSDGMVRGATHRPSLDATRDVLDIVVSLDLAPVAPKDPDPRVEAPRFPVIHQDERSKFSFIIGGGVGGYYDTNPWFGAADLFNAGNPLAGQLPGGRTGWGEAYLELGIGGAAQLGDTPFYAFGALSGIYSLSRGQDIFTRVNRNFLHPEKAYIGVLYADRDTGNSAQLSFGRQTWTLNDGFLISMVAGSSNAGERGATYLGPRNSTDVSALFTGEFGRGRFAFFYIDPDELEDLESNTTIAGVNLGYRFTDSFSADVSYITIPRSDSSYRTPSGALLPRQGTRTFGIHALYRPTTPDHVWLAGEVYRQTNSNFAMSARAGYATVGYIAGSMPWSPSISYRYASFSGDDPETERFERFDSLMSTGLGNWLQGISFGKVYRNANLNTHRIQVNLAPQEGMNLTFSWHGLRADQLNNLGANPALSTLTSRDIGDEYTATVRWALDRNRYFQVVASRAVPGQALRSIGASKPWSTLQASLYVNF